MAAFGLNDTLDFDSIKDFVEQPNNDINMNIDTDSNTILSKAIKDFDKPDLYEIVEYLLNKGADPNHLNFVREVPLGLAMNKCHDTARLLIENGADVNIHLSLVHTLLTYECMCGNMDNIQLLLEHGADPNLKPALHNSWAPIEKAIMSENIEMIKLLIEYGASLDITRVATNDPNDINEIYDKLCNNIDTLEYLLENGFDIDKYGNNNDPQYSIFVHHLMKMSPEIAKLLFTYKVSFHTGDILYDHFLSENEIRHELYRRDVDVEARQAKIIENLKTVKDFGYDVKNIFLKRNDMLVRNGKTSLLIEATAINMFELVVYLVEEIGVDLNFKNHLGTVYYYALNLRDPTIFNFLFKYLEKSDVKIKISMEQTFHSLLSKTSKEFMIEYFYKHNLGMQDFLNIIKYDTIHYTTVVNKERELYKKLSSEKIETFRALRGIIDEDNIIDIILDYKEDCEEIDLLHHWFDKSIYLNMNDFRYSYFYT